MREAIGLVLSGLVVWGGCAELDPSNTAPASVEEALSQTKYDEGAGAGRHRCPRQVPAAVNPPADATLKAALPAHGVQIYVCAVPAAGGTPAWTLKAPHAVLVQGHETAAIHFAGPSWQALDGSLVTAVRSGSAPAPDGTSIPWLSLQATAAAAPGLFDNVTWIQRLATEGGAAPATGCDADHVNAQVLVPYRADYFFYRTAVAGERVHQCAAK